MYVCIDGRVFKPQFRLQSSSKYSIDISQHPLPFQWEISSLAYDGYRSRSNEILIPWRDPKGISLRDASRSSTSQRCREYVGTPSAPWSRFSWSASSHLDKNPTVLTTKTITNCIGWLVGWFRVDISRRPRVFIFSLHPLSIFFTNISNTKCAFRKNRIDCIQWNSSK